MNEDGLGNDLESLKNDVSKLQSDISDITQKLIYKAKTDSGPIPMKDKIIEDLKNELDRARGKGREAFESVKQKIQEKPLMSLLIAFILGLLLGKLLDRR